MNNKSINQQDHLPFPLFNQKFFNEYSQDSQLIGHLNQEMLHLNHKCSYKWMNQPKLEWTLDDDIKILVITWNMHGIIPGYPLKRLFNIQQVHHDLIVIGTQECSRSIAVSLLCESKGGWESKLKDELGKDYVKVQSTTLNAMHLIVFAHVLLVPKIKNGRPYTLSQGFMGIVGNKGGIAISLNINDKIFLFANSHLESGQNAETKRQTQFSKLETHFENQVFYNHKNVPYDYLIWTGDFNSRINQQITTQTIRHHSDFFMWLSNDQMYQSRNQSLNYQSYFHEGMIFFPPTYKMLEYQNQWAIDKDFRIPGWCDRILFKENKKSKTFSHTQDFQDNQPSQIKLQNYDANFDILGSDHRPVFAQFTVSFQ
ncbi:unnamed protein product [Paramecium pentaurelia]|uniref:Inositol polyphosphate-related phosphatase domain-containing protein n=1 Tax=Paramecium pentaurelia TaxID=43138 RepID=A0A8S1SQ50_9CILI|nr:unnamed protein product [Paramecium pentaurelia]